MNAALLPGKIEHWALARLKPYARNAKTHDAGQVAKIAASIAEFGWTLLVSAYRPRHLESVRSAAGAPSRLNDLGGAELPRELMYRKSLIAVRPFQKRVILKAALGSKCMYI